MSNPESAESTQELLYKLKLEGNGITVNREVPEGVARTVIALVMGGQSAAPPAGAVVAPTPGSAAARQSVREFLNGLGAKRNADTITAIAVYLKNMGQETFTRDQVKDQFRRAGEPIPGNYNRDFTDALSTGWIAEDPDDSGNYYITSSGEAAVSNGFPGKIHRPSKRKTRKTDSGDEA